MHTAPLKIILISKYPRNNSTFTSTWFSKMNFAQRNAKTLKSRNPREIYFLALLFAIIWSRSLPIMSGCVFWT